MRIRPKAHGFVSLSAILSRSAWGTSRFHALNAAVRCIPLPVATVRDTRNKCRYVLRSRRDLGWTSLQKSHTHRCLWSYRSGIRTPAPQAAIMVESRRGTSPNRNWAQCHLWNQGSPSAPLRSMIAESSQVSLDYVRVTLIHIWSDRVATARSARHRKP